MCRKDSLWGKEVSAGNETGRNDNRLLHQRHGCTSSASVYPAASSCSLSVDNTRLEAFSHRHPGSRSDLCSVNKTYWSRRVDGTPHQTDCLELSS